MKKWRITFVAEEINGISINLAIILQLRINKRLIKYWELMSFNREEQKEFWSGQKNAFP
jgi:hypothetical protein